MRLSIPVSLLLALVPMTLLVLLVDWIGVRKINQNALGFQVHLYSYGATFVLAALLSAFVLRRKQGRSIPRVYFTGALVAGVWWLATFGLLFYFHGLVGGRY